MNIHLERQHGGALIILILILVIVGTTTLYSFLDGTGTKLERNKKTANALSEAKAALIGYAILNSNKPGTLPCTDNSNNGSPGVSGPNCSSYIGRLPWKQLGTKMLKDGYSECLWYALSPIFRNPMSVSNRITSPLNSNTNGTINLVNDNETSLTGVNPVIAVIFAPQNPLGGQNRSGAPTTFCPGDSTAANYLDAKGLINNATGNVVGNNYTFKLGEIDNSFNDQLVYITAKEFYQLLRKRITKEIIGAVDVRTGLSEYYDEALLPLHTYPCPATTLGGTSGLCLFPPVTGYIPTGNPLLKYTALGTWLTNNNWFALTTYEYLSITHIKVTVSDVLGSYTCDANMNVITCASS